MNYNFNTLYLFNAVLSRPEDEETFTEIDECSSEPVTSNLANLDLDSTIQEKRHRLAVEYGVLVDASALHAIGDIETYMHQNRTPLFKAIDATLYSNWKEVSSKTDLEAFLEQILHYMIGYRPAHPEIPVSDTIPAEMVKQLLLVKYIPENAAKKDTIKLIQSPTALSESTLDNAIELLDYLRADYNKLFDTVKNREARVRIFPKVELECLKPYEFLRFLIFRHIGVSLLIKNTSMIEKIKESQADISAECTEYSLKELSSIFNRFKVLFLAFKLANKANIPVVNKLAKLSKANHRPLAENPLNYLTTRRIEKRDMHWLENAGTAALIRALNMCKLSSSPQHGFRYCIRNGKTWIADKTRSSDQMSCAEYNYSIIRQRVIQRFKESEFDLGAKFYMPSQIEYGIPISEKQLIGVIPYMTKVSKQNEDLVVGITWRAGYGARDLDLSANSIRGKVGYSGSRMNCGVIYSGDIVNLNDQGLATEFVKFEPVTKEEDESDWSLALNCFSGNSEYYFDIMVGNSSCPTVNESDSQSPLDRDYMLNPTNLLMTAYKFHAVKRQCTVGFIRRRVGVTEFIIAPGGDGDRHVKSLFSNLDELSKNALLHKIDHSMTLRELLHDVLGCEMVDHPSEADVDLSPEHLDATFFTRLFN